MKVYNSLSRNKEELVPLKPGQIGMYVCGPTVYDDPHIGHARSAYIFDVVRRYLTYKGFKVLFVRNVTDVDDKIINKAKEMTKAAGGDLVAATGQIAKTYLEAYHNAMGALGIGRPDKEPKATEYIPKMITFIEALIANGAAYASGGDVYFDIKTARSYGKLSNQNLEKMESGGKDIAGREEEGSPGLRVMEERQGGRAVVGEPVGEGAPGWHIECSVMSSDILGDEFDIHGGGVDLIFPHHENEVAQSEGAGKKFARYWLHNGLLTINSEKMAKSLGNFITIRDFLDRYKDPDYLKLLFLNTHYRHPVDYTEEKVAEMKAQKERFLILFDKIDRVKVQGARVKGEGLEEFKKKFADAMDDDFNTPLALAALFDLVTHTNKAMQGRDELADSEAAEIAAAGSLIADLGAVFGLNLVKGVARSEVDEAEVLKLIDKRNKARKDKDFRTADEIRKTLFKDHSVRLEDTKDGTVWRKEI
ncbi:Cysteinyl-tRNA synthetase [sediment metagenome]|uniref:cysteine--tRNA ligase n=1 Tax=sediment metagenome TaxID=749907 RepID=D9PLI8_9ZZZZ